MTGERTSQSTPQRPSARPWWITELFSGTGMGLALWIGWIFSGHTGAGSDVAHASAAEGYGFTEKSQPGDREVEDS